ncbi:MAG: hypothetical protein ABIG44_04200 [Planctomycetota bacterium]
MNLNPDNSQPEQSSGVDTHERPPIPAGWLCPECGYDLRTLTSERCPECGFALDIFRTQEPQIPWVYRRERGRFRTYWHTVWLATFHTKRFCLEAIRPVSYADSQSFRWVTILHAWVPIVIASVCAFMAAAHPDTGHSDLHWWVLLSVLVCSLLGLAALSGVASYSFHPPHMSTEQQNRAIALSYYAWAPLAFAVPTLPLLIGAGFEMVSGNGTLAVALLLASGAVSVFWAMFTSGRFAHQLIRRLGLTVQLGRDTALCLLGGLVLIIILLLPLAALHVLVIVHSLS